MSIPPNIPRIDEKPRPVGVLFQSFNRIRLGFRNRWLINQGKKFWTDAYLLEYDDLHRKIASAILDRQPLSVARLGGVEASLMMWGKRLPGILWRPDSWTLFDDTATGATNAGIRPRNMQSYRVFAELAWDALEHLDLLGVWKTGYEAAVLESGQVRSFFNGEFTGPSGDYASHWMRAL